MAGRTEIQRWMTRRAQLDDRLYARYGKPLESEHRGEFLAISDHGEVICGTDDLEVTKKAVEKFGPGRFALRRIGSDVEARCRHHASLGAYIASSPSGERP